MADSSAASEFTLTEKLRGRRAFTVYGALNSFSFLLLSGNIITLYVLRLNASASFIGLLASFPYLSFFFMLLGRRLVGRQGVVRIFGSSWIVRYLFVLPIAVTPFLAGNRVLAFALILLAVAGFQIFRGVGMVSQSPILGELSAGKDRGVYIGRFQIIVNTASIISGLMISFLVTPDAPLSRFSALIVAGILLGILGAVFIYRLPEPRNVRAGSGADFLANVKRSFSDRNFRLFIGIFALYCVTTGMMRPFLVVYAKQVYAEPDSSAILFSVIGSIGAIAMAAAQRQLIDRLGAKPMYVLFALVYAASMVPAIVSPAIGGVGASALLAALFFFTSFGSSGGENSAQNYFYGMIRVEDQLDLGIVYFVTMGFAGGIGSFAGGLLLDSFHSQLAMTSGGAYRLYFIVITTVLLLAIAAMSFLARLGSRSFRSALGVIFSLRDLRAINLLNRLDRTMSIDEEQQVIREIAGSQSEVATEELLQRLQSPSFVIRSEALHAIERLEPGPNNVGFATLEPQIAKALTAQLKQQEFTTAYVAARIIGKRQIRQGAPVLRDALTSEDYLLAARSMVALAQLGDRQSIPRIQLVLRVTRNPLLLIHGAAALRIFDHRPSISLLLDILRREDAPPYLRDEIILAIAGLSDIESWFYPCYTRFLDRVVDGISLLRERFTSARSRADDADEPRDGSDIVAAIDDFAGTRAQLPKLLSSAVASNEQEMVEDIPNEFFLKALDDSRVNRFERFLFLVLALVIDRDLRRSGDLGRAADRPLLP